MVNTQENSTAVKKPENIPNEIDFNTLKSVATPQEFRKLIEDETNQHKLAKLISDKKVELMNMYTDKGYTLATLEQKVSGLKLFNATVNSAYRILAAEKLPEGAIPGKFDETKKIFENYTILKKALEELDEVSENKNVTKQTANKEEVKKSVEVEKRDVGMSHRDLVALTLKRRTQALLRKDRQINLGISDDEKKDVIESEPALADSASNRAVKIGIQKDSEGDLLTKEGVASDKLENVPPTPEVSLDSVVTDKSKNTEKFDMATLTKWKKTEHGHTVERDAFSQFNTEMNEIDGLLSSKDNFNKEAEGQWYDEWVTAHTLRDEMSDLMNKDGQKISNELQRKKEQLDPVMKELRRYIVEDTEEENTIQSEYQKILEEHKNSSERSDTQEEEYNKKYKEHYTALAQTKGWKGFQNKVKRFFGIDAELPEELKTLKVALDSAKNEYRAKGSELSKIALDAHSDRVRTEGQKSAYELAQSKGGENSNISKSEWDEKVHTRYERMLARKLLINSIKKRQSIQADAFSSVEPGAASKFLNTFGKYKWGRRALSVGAYALVGGVTGGIGTAVAAGGAKGLGILGAAGAGAVAGTSVSSLYEKFQVNKARENVDIVEDGVRKDFFEKNFKTLEHTILTSIANLDSKERRKKVYATVAAGIAGAIVGGNISGAVDQAPDVVDGASGESNAPIAPKADEQNWANNTNSKIDNLTQGGKSHDGSINKVTESKPEIIQKPAPIDPSGKGNTPTQNSEIVSPQAKTVEPTVPKEPVMPNAEADHSTGSEKLTVEKAQYTYPVEAGDTAWTAMEQASIVLPNASDSDVTLNELFKYMEKNPEFTKSVGIASGDPNIIVPGESIRVDLMDTKLMEIATVPPSDSDTFTPNNLPIGSEQDIVPKVTESLQEQMNDMDKETVEKTVEKPESNVDSNNHNEDILIDPKKGTSIPINQVDMREAGIGATGATVAAGAVALPKASWQTDPISVAELKQNTKKHDGGHIGSVDTRTDVATNAPEVANDNQLRLDGKTLIRRRNIWIKEIEGAKGGLLGFLSGHKSVYAQFGEYPVDRMLELSDGPEQELTQELHKQHVSKEDFYSWINNIREWENKIGFPKSKGLVFSAYLDLVINADSVQAIS